MLASESARHVRSFLEERAKSFGSQYLTRRHHELEARCLGELAAIVNQQAHATPAQLQFIEAACVAAVSEYQGKDSRRPAFLMQLATIAAFANSCGLIP